MTPSEQQGGEAQGGEIQAAEQRAAEMQAAEAEAQAEAAEARAEAARARAEELRRQLAPPSSWRDSLIGAVAIALLIGLWAATSVMLWQHHKATQRSQQVAEFAAAARQSVVNLMSIDYTSAKDSVQRVLDGSTGKFRDNFAETADDFVKALQEEKIVTKAVVNDAAVESMTGDSAVVLVSATSRREGPQAPKDQQEPRLWRVVLTLERDGGQIKMSGVEFA